MKGLLAILHEISATGLLVVHILLAICVTVHVLLHKRDVGASIRLEDLVHPELKL